MYKICKGYDFKHPLSVHNTYAEAIQALQCIGKVILLQENSEYNYFAVGEQCYTITKNISEETSQIISDLKKISELLDYAANHGMLDEVVYSAIEFAKSNQTASPSDCMEAGINEWIK